MASALQQQFSEAKALEADGEYARAEQAYARLSTCPETEMRARRRRTECLIRLQRWDEAAEDMAYVLEHADPPLVADMKRWLSMRAQFGTETHPSDPLTPFVMAQRASGAFAPGPYLILTAAAPKTGSTSLSVALAAATRATKLNYIDLPPTTGVWGSPWWPAVDALQGFGLVNHCHLSPDPETISNIAARPWVKVAIHLRNPVETITSTIDMMIRQRSPNLLSGAPKAALTADDAIRAFVLTHYLHKLRDWMVDWIALYDQGHPSVIGLTTMDEMRSRGQDAIARDLVARLPGLAPNSAQTQPQGTGQRIVGDKAVQLTPQETDRVRAAMPPGLLERFGWT